MEGFTHLLCWLQVRPHVIGTLAGNSAGVGIALVPGSAFLMNPTELWYAHARVSVCVPWCGGVCVRVVDIFLHV
jgi:hypothetical protein